MLRQLDEKMMKLGIATAAVVIAALATPAFAAAEFCVVQDVKTKKRTVADERPIETSMPFPIPDARSWERELQCSRLPIIFRQRRKIANHLPATKSAGA